MKNYDKKGRWSPCGCDAVQLVSGYLEKLRYAITFDANAVGNGNRYENKTHRETTMTQRVFTIAVAFALLTGSALGQSTSQPSGSIQGVVFTTEQDHAHAVVPGTKLSLDGPLHLEAESDSEGKFIFRMVPAGSYTITATQASGLAATQNIEVQAASVSQLELEMKIPTVAQSTTVTATTDDVETKESSGTNAIGESAVVHMPNRDEHFESLLPLVPGVVRGPNGQINMKGARASQNGSLVNSADVTDPATGTTRDQHSH